MLARSSFIRRAFHVPNSFSKTQNIAGRQVKPDDLINESDPENLVQNNPKYEYREVPKVDEEESNNVTHITKLMKPAFPDMSNNQDKEYGLRIKGLEPTRYGDWERKGRCSDF